MSWPMSQDYNEAIQNPSSCFSDPQLQQGEAVCNAAGLPVPCSGNFADVYQVRGSDGARWAVKCFTRQVAGLRERYAAVSDHLRRADLSVMVDFQYLDQGIRVHGLWYPVVKMRWVEGLTLNQFVRGSLDTPALLDAVGERWRQKARQLREARIAHGDLQHGNVLLVPGPRGDAVKLRLIDYDGMWVPALASRPSGEVGHPAYQHPQRLRERTYGPEVDRFPVLLVATALACLKVGGRPLWERYDNGDNLLFREADLQAPTKSPLFYELLKGTDPLARKLVGHTLDALRGRLESVPLLEEVLSGQPAAAAPVPAAPVVGVPSWVKDVDGSGGGTAAPPVPSRVPVQAAAGVPDYIHSLKEAGNTLGQSGAEADSGPVDPVVVHYHDITPEEGTDQADSDPEPAEGPPPYRRTPRATAALVLVGVLLMTAAAGTVWWYALQQDPTSTRKPPPHGLPRADKEGVQWQIADLSDFLKNRGLKFEERDRQGARGVRLERRAEMVFVTDWPDAEEAKKRLDDPHGPGWITLQWGRFTLSGEKQSPFLNEIRAALPGTQEGPKKDTRREEEDQKEEAGKKVERLIRQVEDELRKKGEPEKEKGPEVGREGVEGEIDQLINRLGDRGLKFKVAKRPGGVPGVWLDRQAELVLVIPWPDAVAAQQELANRRERQPNWTHFRWGRFTLSGKPSAFLDEIRLALSGKAGGVPKGARRRSMPGGPP
jgi:hypothetical protein